MVIAGTGHRPHKLGGYSEQVFNRLVDLAKAVIRETGATKVISGMALGWDQALAQAAVELGVPFVAAVPFKGQERKWPEASQVRYWELLDRAERVVIVSTGGFSREAMETRNEWMVDHADLLVALWDSGPSGTGNCIAYAQRIGKPVQNHWARWVRYAGV